jgi:hypothetical protein
LNTKKILVLSNTALLLVPSLEKSLSQASIPYKVAFSRDYSIDEADLVFIDQNVLMESQGMQDSLAKYKNKFVVMSALIDHDTMNRILIKTQARHLIGLSGPNSLSDMRDIIITNLANEIWPADTFFKKPKTVTEKTFSSSQGVTEAIQELLKGHDFSGYFEGIEDFLTQILNESIINAIFNAPVNDKGEKTHCGTHRGLVVHMTPDKEPVAKVMTDDRKVVISVKDFYGSLTEKDIFDHLPQGEIKQKKGGAGIGMFIIMKYAHKFIINIEPGKMTENIILIEEDKRFKWFSTKEKSFHLFIR